MHRIHLHVGLLMIPVIFITLVLPLVAGAQTNSCIANTAIYGTPGSYTFTVPAGVTELRIVAVGGGGGGGAGSGGWGSGGGGGCGGALAGGSITVTPGQKIPLYVGYGGTGGNGSSQTGAGGCPWCGSYNPSSNGSTGGTSGIASITAAGGGWGRTGYHNLYNQYAGGSGGGSGGGGGGNGWPGFSAVVGSGGTAGGQTNSQGAGGYCTGSGWSINPGSYITNISWTAGAGGQEPAVASYYGGGGGGGLIVNGSSARGSDAPGACSWGCPGTGGNGYGGGGGGQGLDYQGAGGAGGPGLVYIEWNGGESNGSCALSCSVTFDKNPLTGQSTKIRWSSSNASLFYIKSIGYVSGSGSAQVYAPGDYSGYVSGIGATASCPAVLEGTDSCEDESSSLVCGSDGNLRNSCGQIATSCQYGCSTTTNQCKAAAACESLLVCDASGSRVVNICNGSTVDDCTSRGLMCVAGACRISSIGFESFTATDVDERPFTASGHLLVAPSLVPKDTNTRVYWNVTNAKSCMVTASNGDGTLGSGTGIWNTMTSGASGKTTSLITGQTTYTLLCYALPGATPATAQESVRVDILPSFLEL